MEGSDQQMCLEKNGSALTDTTDSTESDKDGNGDALNDSDKQMCLEKNGSALTYMTESDKDVNGDALNDSDEDGNGDKSNDVPENELEESEEGQKTENWFEYDEDGDDESEDEEVYKMIEQGIVKQPESKPLEEATVDQHPSPVTAKAGKCPIATNEPTIKKITILDEKDENAFEVLPGDWIKVRHSSGLPLYLHRPTRVCTLAKPYYLGPASVRLHSVPLSAIPCLAYRRGLEKEQKDKESLEEQREEQVETPSVVDEATKTQGDALINSSKETNSPLRKKLHALAGGSVAEKVIFLKRKYEIEKASSDAAKRLKPDGCSKGGQGDSLSEETSTKESATAPNENEPMSGKNEAGICQNNVSKESREKLVKEVPIVITKHMKKTEVPSTISTLSKRLNNKRVAENMPGAKTLIPLAKVETARENASLYSVVPADLREYCKSLFRFSVVECKRFKTWSARRMHSKEQKRKQLERPTLPDNAQVIKFFDLNECKGGEETMAKKFNDYVFNPNGKSSVCILHEFVQHALRKQPTYAFQELENAATPYAATVMINSIPYGKGLGSSKRTAKAAAAQATLEILIPQMKVQLNGNKSEPGNDFDITEYFQQVGMNDVRIAKLCASVSEPSPYTLLLTCLQRNYGQSGSTGVKFEMVTTDLSKGNIPNQFSMTAGKVKVVVQASNKREGKQLASQLLLSKLHPHITNFGAFIKMYGNGSIKSVKEKKQEEQQITTLQSKASANSPNWAILDKLRQEMMKLAEQEKAGEEANYEIADESSYPPSSVNTEDSPSISNASDTNENVTPSYRSDLPLPNIYQTNDPPLPEIDQAHAPPLSDSLQTPAPPVPELLQTPAPPVPELLQTPDPPLPEEGLTPTPPLPEEDLTPTPPLPEEDLTPTPPLSEVTPTPSHPSQEVHPTHDPSLLYTK